MVVLGGGSFSYERGTPVNPEPGTGMTLGPTLQTLNPGQAERVREDRRGPPCTNPHGAYVKRDLYRETSLIRHSATLGPYSGNMPRALWWS